MRLIKCYYCGEYFDEEEAIGWDICASCALDEEEEYRWYAEESEDWLLQGLDVGELNDKGISVKLTKWEDD